MSRAGVFREGMRDGVPIGLGYFAVAFSLGIVARSAGLTPAQGMLASALTNASAGEYAAFTLMAAGGGYLQMAVVTLVTNARYLLMSCAMSQKLPADTPLWQRVLLGFDLTDEIFGIAMARPGKADPFYSFGAMVPAIPGWALGTFAGILAGNIMPGRVVSALSVALFGMFLAVVIPPARENRTLLGVVAVSFAASLAMSVAPVLSQVSAGNRIIILTVAISAVAAWLFPVSEGVEDAR